MNVILLESVENLGGIGDLVKVKPGYGRNYLLPQGKAALATDANMKSIEARRAELEKAAAGELASAKARAKAFEGLEIVVNANAGSEGKLFGSVGPIDLVEALAASREVDAEHLEFLAHPTGPDTQHDAAITEDRSGSDRLRDLDRMSERQDVDHRREAQTARRRSHRRARGRPG